MFAQNLPKSFNSTGSFNLNRTVNPLLSHSKSVVVKTSIDKTLFSTIYNCSYEWVLCSMAADVKYSMFANVNTDSDGNQTTTVRKPEVLHEYILSSLTDQISALDTRTHQYLFDNINEVPTFSAIKSDVERLQIMLEPKDRFSLMRQLVIAPAVGKAKRLYVASEIKDIFDTKQRRMVQNSSHLRTIHTGAGSAKATKPIISHSFNKLGDYSSDYVKANKVMGMENTVVMKNIMNRKSSQMSTNEILKQNISIGKMNNNSIYNQRMQSLTQQQQHSVQLQRQQA